MKDKACIQFLQWALPQLHLRWPGFRKVRHQVCKRVDRRIKELKLNDLSAYQDFLQSHLQEWEVLDSLCCITISRFYRDRGVFDSIGEEVLPALAQRVSTLGDKTIWCWCVGCASGEEPYTLMMIWNFCVKPHYPDTELRIIATDIDPVMLERAQQGCYQPSSLKELPSDWLSLAFRKIENQFCLLPRYAENVHFFEQDIRQEAPNEQFHLILCRNLAFTYFNTRLQHEIVRRIYDKLFPEGVVIVGVHEYLPSGAEGFSPWIRNKKIYRRSAS